MNQVPQCSINRQSSVNIQFLKYLIKETFIWDFFSKTEGNLFWVNQHTYLTDCVKRDLNIERVKDGSKKTSKEKRFLSWLTLSVAQGLADSPNFSSSKNHRTF